MVAEKISVFFFRIKIYKNLPCDKRFVSVAATMSSKVYDASSTAEEVIKEFAGRAENMTVMITGANTGLGELSMIKAR